MTSTHENKGRTCDAFLQRSDHPLAFELVLASRNMLLLVIESAKDIAVLARIQETNAMNVIIPIMFSSEVAFLLIIIELAMTKVFLQRVLTLLRMRANQNAVIRKLRMIRIHQ